ncbi:MAG: hypothetical protein KatS3mg015_1787 [Fimbriimonadales bacterium]|nr:MAG: hypothetical protein KatS3mg015_1787 [Fimbriimonadales bacterium]
MLTHVITFALAPLMGAPQMPAPPIRADALRAHVEYLSSDALEGRFTGSEGERKATEYAKKVFEEAGLKPGGENGTFFQEFPVRFGIEPVPGSYLRIRVGSQVHEAEVGKDFVPVYNGDAANLTTGSLVFVGEGISSEERDDYSGIDVQGKVVVVFPSSGRAASNRAKARTAQEKGAVGILFAGTPEGAGLLDLSGRNAILRSENFFAAAISSDFFEKVSGMKFEEARRQALVGRVMPGFPREATVELKTGTQPKTLTGRNVIAILPGNDPTLANQYIVIGAHIDHIGHGETGALARDANDDIYNGADDNSSGTATVLELAKYFSRTKSNSKTLVFQLYSGEELGLVGSRYWVAHPTVDLKAITAMINLDMVGNLVDNKLIVDGARSSPIWKDLIARFSQGFEVEFDPTGRRSVAGRSDHAAFESAGIPVLFFNTDEHERYHRPNDTADKLNYEGMERIANLVLNVVVSIDAMPGMVPFQNKDQIVERQPPESQGRGGGRRVRVGLIPDYSDPGPGLLLEGVSENSPAQKAGLQAGDRIIQWDDIKITTIEDLQFVFERAEPGKPATVTIIRDGKEMKVTVIPEPPMALLLRAA